mmetsp:Transcript_30315/g.47045  ORF Transcript_30315/g.47045 Transcript_30315/m.47045 type:complete len:105 (+) Transcript_30315:540-854(+)
MSSCCRCCCSFCWFLPSDGGVVGTGGDVAVLGLSPVGVGWKLLGVGGRVDGLGGLVFGFVGVSTVLLFVIGDLLRGEPRGEFPRGEFPRGEFPRGEREGEGGER